MIKWDAHFIVVIAWERERLIQHTERENTNMNTNFYWFSHPPTFRVDIRLVLCVRILGWNISQVITQSVWIIYKIYLYILMIKGVQKCLTTETHYEKTNYFLKMYTKSIQLGEANLSHCSFSILMLDYGSLQGVSMIYEQIWVISTAKILNEMGIYKTLHLSTKSSAWNGANFKSITLREKEG